MNKTLETGTNKKREPYANFSGEVVPYHTPKYHVRVLDRSKPFSPEDHLGFYMLADNVNEVIDFFNSNFDKKRYFIVQAKQIR